MNALGVTEEHAAMQGADPGPGEIDLGLDPGLPIFVAVWIGSVFVAWYLAAESGRHPAKWILWSLLLGPIGVLALVLTIRYEGRQ